MKHLYIILALSLISLFVNILIVKNYKNERYKKSQTSDSDSESSIEFISTTSSSLFSAS